ncbi:TPA: hypothetical protein DIC38_00855 [Candidatus Nomurabacteria bacterium]|nr:MAG: Transposase [Parcubacteria bacterium RAAC4_OD1_1]HCY26221.1 hypothetical protein [Candidatus Nomurabacteria bacterium]
MSIRPIKFAPNENYHIYNRGVNKMNIFIDHNDYDRFMKLMYVSNSTTNKKFTDIETSPGKAWTLEKDSDLVDIVSYCLMPNHFHFILREKIENGISIFMHRLSTSYSMYFNKKYDRNGALFQGKFKSEHINNDNYFKYLFSYIHLNPIKLIQKDWKEIGIKNIDVAQKYLLKYPYSSFLDIIEKINRIESKIINKLSIPNYFGSPENFKKEIFDWLIVKI